MGNTDKFDSIANSYDNPERTHIAKASFRRHQRVFG